ncbi:hypothetical protein R6Q59_034553 [Mikania micrantha]
MGSRVNDFDLQRLIPLRLPETHGDSKSSSPADSPPGAPSSARQTGKEAFFKVIHSWATKKFMSGCVILFPIAITFYVTWWFIQFVDGFFSPLYTLLGINNYGLGFVTSITFIFLVGVFMSSWLGANLLSLGEFIIKKMPFMSYIYTASKQISVAISPGQGSNAFKEVAIIKHPSPGEYAFGFITSTLVLRKNSGAEELCCVYVPTNHLYMGDIVLVNSKDVMRPNISVREGIEIVISGGMSIPNILTMMNMQNHFSERAGNSSYENPTHRPPTPPSAQPPATDPPIVPLHPPSTVDRRRDAIEAVTITITALGFHPTKGCEGFDDGMRLRLSPRLTNLRLKTTIADLGFRPTKGCEGSRRRDEGDGGRGGKSRRSSGDGGGIAKDELLWRGKSRRGGCRRWSSWVSAVKLG